MISSGRARSPKDRWLALGASLACILLLMWPAMVNRVAMLGRLPMEDRRLLGLGIALLAGAMLAHALFGGAVSEPQSRYQARIVWLIPLIAAVAVLVRCRARLIGGAA